MRNFFFCMISIFFFDIFNSAYAYYHPTPEMVPAVTTAVINGHWYNDKTMYYPLGSPLCYTAAEAAARDALPDTSVWFSTDPPTSCKKCPTGDWILVGNSGSEICLQGCPSPYVYGTYFDTSGCFKCTDNYVFRSGDCQWNGVGSPPPRPAPLPAKNLSASDGTLNTISIKWNPSASADYYELYRAIVQFSSSVQWSKIGSPADNNFEDGTQTNGETVKPCATYQYKVKACNYDFQCSYFSNTDQGHLSLEKPKITAAYRFLKAPGAPELGAVGNLVKWSYVPLSQIYKVHVAQKSGYNATFSDKNFDELGARTDRIAICPLARTVAIQACCSTLSGCGEAVLYNPYIPSIDAWVNLLLNER